MKALFLVYSWDFTQHVLLTASVQKVHHMVGGKSFNLVHTHKVSEKLTIFYALPKISNIRARNRVQKVL